MYSPSTNFREQIKNIVREMQNSKMFVLSGVVTSVNNDPPYTVKVNLEPHGIETGWIPIASSYAGNGFGVVLPPPEEGTHVQVLFDMGDFNSGVVIGGLYNNVSVPPSVTFGDAAIVHKSGSSLILKNDGSIEIKAAPGKQVIITGNTTQSW